MRVVPVGRVIAGHGLRGAVKFKYYNEDIDQFKHYALLIADRDGKQTELNPTEVRFNKGFFYLKFEGLNSPEKVSFLINQELGVREEDLPPLDNDEYYDYQLIGLKVLDQNRHSIGIVTEVLHTGVNEIIVVKGKGETLVPMVEGLILEINLKDSVIVINRDRLLV